MSTRTIMMHARHGQFAKLTDSQLQIAALKAFPSSPFQKSIQKEMAARRKETKQ